jgi:flagellar motility protein MotE (MotC chaperone)
MKSVLIFSVLTFVLIFGGVAYLSSQMGQLNSPGVPLLPGFDPSAADLAAKQLAEQRTALRREKDQLMLMRQATVVQNQILSEARDRLLAVAREIESRQGLLSEDRERSAAKLAKMYENMKPQDAAPILGALEIGTVLEVMTRMREREAARVLVHMPPELAAQITTGLSLEGEG